MSNNPNDPNSPSSALSKKARLAHWITGGTNRSPSTMSSFSRMTKDRNDIKKATKAWKVARERGLDEHQGQWGRSGVLGALDQGRGTATMPRGTALLRWFREGGVSGGRGGRGAVDGREADTATREPEQLQQNGGGQERSEKGLVEADAEDDIYGADDDAVGMRAVGGETGDDGAMAGRANGDDVGQQQTQRSP